MSKSYKVVKKTMNMGEKKGQTVYSVRPVSYGTLTTEELLGFGTLYLRFITNKAVSEPKKANANLVKSIMPGFRPSFSVDRNGKRTYDLIPNRISLVKYSEDNDPNGDNNPSDKGDNTPGGTTPSGGDTPAGGNTGSGTDEGDYDLK